MIRSLYNWTMSLADHPSALWVLFIVSFAESSFFPIPPDVIMIPMIIARPNRAFSIACVALIGSILGGLAGYGIGAFAFDAIGQPILESLGKAHYFEEFQHKYNEWGVWVVMVAGITPFPYKVITIMSGATALPLWVFVMSSIAARAIRFFAIAALLYFYGPPVRDFIERRLGLVFIMSTALILCGFLALKLF